MLGELPEQPTQEVLPRSQTPSTENRQPTQNNTEDCLPATDKQPNSPVRPQASTESNLTQESSQSPSSPVPDDVGQDCNKNSEGPPRSAPIPAPGLPSAADLEFIKANERKASSTGGPPGQPMTAVTASILKKPSFAFPRLVPSPAQHPKLTLARNPIIAGMATSTPVWSPMAQSLFCPPPHLQQPQQQPAPQPPAYYYCFQPAQAPAATPAATLGLPVSCRERSPFWGGTGHYLTNPPPPPPQIYSVEPAYVMQQPQLQAPAYYQAAAVAAPSVAMPQATSAPAYYYVAGQQPVYYYAG